MVPLQYSHSIAKVFLTHMLVVAFVYSVFAKTGLLLCYELHDLHTFNMFKNHTYMYMYLQI